MIVNNSQRTPNIKKLSVRQKASKVSVRADAASVTLMLSPAAASIDGRRRSSSTRRWADAGVERLRRWADA
jgi:hypothetical protein